VRQVQIVVVAGIDEPIRRTDRNPGTVRFSLNPIPVLARSLRRIGRIKMWSSRNQMLTDNDGDDVAFLSGSGATVTTVTLKRDDCDVIIIYRDDCDVFCSDWHFVLIIVHFMTLL
jgi:hypothetical protein